MEMKFILACVVIALALSPLDVVKAQDSCQAPCSATECVCNGKYFDLSGIQGDGTPFISTLQQQGADSYLYYLQIVNGGLPSSGLQGCDWGSPSYSHGNVAGQSKEPSMAGGCVSLGQVGSPVWSINTQLVPPVISVAFSGGAPAVSRVRNTVLWVTCDPTKTGPVTNVNVVENPPLTYNYRVSHVSGCPASPKTTTTAPVMPTMTSIASGCDSNCSAMHCVCNGKAYDFTKFNNGTSNMFEIVDGSFNQYVFMLVAGGLPSLIPDVCGWDNPSYSLNNVAGFRPWTNSSCMSIGNVNEVSWTIVTSIQPQLLILDFTGGEPVEDPQGISYRMRTTAVVQCCSDCQDTILRAAYLVPYQTAVNFMFYSPLACP